MSTITSKAFWVATAERVIGTAGATFLAAIGSTALIEQVDWRVIASTVALAAVLTLVKALVAATTTDGGPGFGTSEELAPEAPVKTQTHRADV